jgi:hypothetical protein
MVSLIISAVTTTIIFVSFPLNEISSPGACTSADQRTFLAADQCSTYCAGNASDDGPFSLTMAISAPPPVATILGGPHSDESPQYQSDTQKYCDEVFRRNCSNHSSSFTSNK